jgi:hypothetical protein
MDINDPLRRPDRAANGPDTVRAGHPPYGPVKSGGIARRRRRSAVSKVRADLVLSSATETDLTSGWSS